MDLSLCVAGSITMALVILGISPEGGQQQICAWHLPEGSWQTLEMQNRLPPQLQLELHHLKITSTASFAKIYFLN